MVPPPRGESSANRPPIAAARSARHSRPPPGLTARAADAVVADLDREPVAAVGRRAACTRSRGRGAVGVGDRLGDQQVGGRLDHGVEAPAGQLAQVDRERRPRRERPAARRRARARRARRDAGRARARPSRRWPPSRRRARRPAAPPPASRASRARSATRSLSASATTCWCAPSCSARSSRRRASSPASTRRVRDAASSARASALASAWASSPASPTSRCSQPGGSDSSSAAEATSAPQASPWRSTGAATVAFSPSDFISVRQLAAGAVVAREPGGQQRALRAAERAVGAVEVQLGVDRQPAHAAASGGRRR